MEFIGSFSALTLREQLLSILRSQVNIAFSYVERASRHRPGPLDRNDLASARRVYDGAVSLRRKIATDDDETREIDRELDRLARVILKATEEVRRTG